MAKRKPAPEICPVCGEDVPRDALACPECGSDHETGWKDEPLYSEDDPADFDYDEFVEQEFGSSPKPHGIKWYWWVAAIVLLAMALWGIGARVW